MPLITDTFTLMMLYEITVPAGMARRTSWRDKPKQKRALTALWLLSTNSHLHPCAWPHLDHPSAFQCMHVLMLVDSIQDLAANSRSLKYFQKGCASWQLYYCWAFFLAEGFAVEAWDQGLQLEKGQRSGEAVASPWCIFLACMCSGRGTVNKTLL